MPSTVPSSRAPAALSLLSCADERLKGLRDRIAMLYNCLSCVEAGGGLRGFMGPGDLPEKFQMRQDAYPRLTMRFTDAERKALANHVGMTAQQLLDEAQTPLERILSAVLWKNGDLGKVGHIADGLSEDIVWSAEPVPDAHAPVFRQFGRHLAAPAIQPIADQHTLRAYRLFTEGEPRDKRHFADTVKGEEVRQYVEWVRRMAEACGDDPADEDAAARLHDFDRSMFALGKATKAFLKAVIQKSDRV